MVASLSVLLNSYKFECFVEQLPEYKWTDDRSGSHTIDSSTRPWEISQISAKNKTRLQHVSYDFKH